MRGVVAEVAEQLHRPRRRLEALERARELVEVRGGDALHEQADVHQGLALDGVDEIGDVMEVRVERAAREAGALGEAGDGNTREVAGGLDLCGEGVAQLLATTQRSPVEPHRGDERGRGACAGHGCLWHMPPRTVSRGCCLPVPRGGAGTGGRARGRQFLHIV